MNDVLVKLSDAYKPRFLGMGLLWAWIYCSWFTGVLFPHRSGFIFNASDTWLTSSLSVALTLLITPFIIREREVYSLLWLRITAVVFMSLGTMLEADASLTGIAFDTLHLFGGLMTGIGCGWMFLMWGEFYARIDTELTEAITPASAIIPPLCLIVIDNLTGGIGLTIVMLLPIFSALLLTLAFKDSRTGERAAFPEEGTQKGFYVHIALLGLMFIAVFTSTTFVNSLVTESDLEIVGRSFQIPTVIGSLAAIVLSIMSIVYSRTLSVFAALRWFLPMMAMALTLISINTEATHAAAIVLSEITSTGFQIMSWMFLVRIARKGWKTPAICIGLSRGAIQLGVVLGNVVAIGLSPLVALGSISVGNICLFLIVFCVLAMSVLIGKKTQIEAMGKDGADNTTLPDIDSRITSAKLELARNEKLAQAGLTERETEVFWLLAKGRNLPYIRDTLYISKNTVDSHIKNIYRKLDIHSKQDLIDYSLTLLSEVPETTN